MNISFLSINTQFENLGDALINRELIKLLSENGKVFVEVSSSPDWFVNLLELPSQSEKIKGNIDFIKAIIKARISGDSVYYFYVPGGRFGDISNSQLFKKLFILFLFMLLKTIGVNFCSVGMSFERLGPNFLRYLRFRNFCMHRFYVRDLESSKLLKAKNIKHDGILPDLAFNLFSGKPKSVDSINKVCFSFRVDQHVEQFNNCYALVEKVVKNLPENTNYYISIQVERDTEGMQLLADKLKNNHNIIVEIKNESRDIEAMLSFYKNMDLIVSNRLHVLLLGGSVTGHLLAFADENNKKISGLFSTVGRSELLINEKSSNEDVIRVINSSHFDGRFFNSKLRAGIKEIFEKK